MSNISYREINYENDIDEIISLLGKSFSSNHNKEDFLWKHFENPFGKSYGLLAICNNLIVGLRMFMYWEFLIANEVVKAIRPVDTCTHPDYRGRGIFKRLTLTGLKNISSEYRIIFNTPNSNSRPGYLKMGWNELDNHMQYRLGIVNFFKKTFPFENISNENLPQLTFKLQNGTHVTRDYLIWRYRNKSYKIAQFGGGESFLIYKIEKLKGIKTLILFEVFGNALRFPNHLTSVCLRNNTYLVYYLDSQVNINLDMVISVQRGKQVVVYKDDADNLVNRINFSLGDLEGKL